MFDSDDEVSRWLLLHLPSIGAVLAKDAAVVTAARVVALAAHSTGSSPCEIFERPSFWNCNETSDASKTLGPSRTKGNCTRELCRL